jgi:biopolymer transport protein ExbD
MKIKRKKKPRFAELVVASDLAFLLIVYFIVIAGFNMNKGFLLSLPQKDSVRMVQRDELVRFELDASGRLYFQGERQIDTEEAAGIIAKAHSENPDIAVVLTIDPAANWQSVVSFVEVARTQKIEAFSFAMRKGGQQ